VDVDLSLNLLLEEYKNRSYSIDEFYRRISTGKFAFITQYYFDGTPVFFSEFKIVNWNLHFYIHKGAFSDHYRELAPAERG
jgi:hypothetical protein